MANLSYSSAGRYDELLTKCQATIGHVFSDRSLLQLALTHASGASHRLASNERLEFLGDAILGEVVCETLYRLFPEADEGELTKIKSVVVSRQTCAKVSIEGGLQEFLILGKGMAANPDVPPSVLANVFEAILAAIYLDGGKDVAAAFVARYIGPEIEVAVASETGENYKSQLQQLAQRDYATTPGYELLDVKGPDHSKCFKIRAQVAKSSFQPAWGRNKKQAEQRAACNALCELKGEPPPFQAD